MMSKPVRFTLQEGFQRNFSRTAADIAIGGGAAGAGKSYALLLEALRYASLPDYAGAIFRKTYPQIKAPGGLWDTSMKIYPSLSGTPTESNYEWRFGTGSKLKFSHLEYEKNVLDWQGAQVPFIGFDELTHFCVDGETELLTKDGWKLVKDAKIGERVASFSKKREIQFKPITATYESPYSGEMIRVKQRGGVDFMVTPNHKLVTDKQYVTRPERHLKEWAFREAGTVKSAYIPRTGVWNPRRKPYVVKLPTIKGRGYGTNSNSAFVGVDTALWLEFLGWYLSEGCCFRFKNRTGTRAIKIRQTKLEGKVKLRKVLDALPWRYREEVDGNFCIFSRQLYEMVCHLGNTHTKRVPKFVFDLPVEQINRFLDGFIDGDGHRPSKGGVQFGLANEGLIDDLQYLFFLTGRVCTKGHMVTKTGFDVYQLNVSKSRIRSLITKKNIERINWSGNIYCVTVADNHNFLMRRNGRYCWTGNSEYSFTYLLSRNRSILPERKEGDKLKKSKPYVRATCNPDPDSWVANFISWWIDQDHNSEKYGFPIPERAGKLRYYIKDSNEYVWGNTKKEVLDQTQHVVKILQEADPTINPNDLVKSVTFIPGTIYGNRELLRADPGYLGNLLAQDDATQSQLLHGNWKVRVDGTDLIKIHEFKETFNNYTIPSGRRYITADIALKGSDLLVVYVWEGFRIIACEVMPKSRGDEVIDLLKRIASTYSVPNGNIAYDDDGAGSFVDGFIRNAKPFNNNRRALMRENYKNLKTQMYYKMADRINHMGYYVDPKVAKMMIGNRTIEQHMIEERRAIKRDKVDEDGKLCIIPKDKMKEIIGHSPDFMDAWMIREYFEFLEPESSSQGISKAAMGFA